MVVFRTDTNNSNNNTYIFIVARSRKSFEHVFVRLFQLGATDNIKINILK